MKVKIHMKKTANFNFLAAMCYCNVMRAICQPKEKHMGNYTNARNTFSFVCEKKIFFRWKALQLCAADE